MMDTSIKKSLWIEYLRAMCILAVILNHTCMTVVNNYSIEEVGTSNYAILNVIFMFVRFAVPCFIMITGWLLLSPEKKITPKKLSKYVIRMFLVLATFGVFYSFLELFFVEKSINIKVVMKAILNTLEGESWSHMWYIYMLLGLYLITPIMKSFVVNSSEKVQFTIILILFTCNCVIVTVNDVLGTDIERYIVLDVYVMYYLLGGYISYENNKIEKNSKLVFVIGIMAVIISCVTEYIGIVKFGKQPLWNHKASNVITPCCAVAVFLFAKKIYAKCTMSANKIMILIAKNSFAMFLIHPFFINIMYKYMGIMPTCFSNVFFGVIVFFVGITVVSLLGAIILRNIPVIKKIL